MADNYCACALFKLQILPYNYEMVIMLYNSQSFWRLGYNMRARRGGKESQCLLFCGYALPLAGRRVDHYTLLLKKSYLNLIFSRFLS
jgi:hypothetical protein